MDEVRKLMNRVADAKNVNIIQQVVSYLALCWNSEWDSVADLLTSLTECL